MYRLHFISNKWLCAKCEEETLSDLIDADVDDLENIITLVDEGTPTILVSDLSELPEGLEYEEVE